MPLRSLVLTQYGSVTGRQTDMPLVAYTALAKLALRCAVTKAVIDISKINYFAYQEI